MNYSYLQSLKCSRCDEEYDAFQVQTICHKCDSHLLAQYDLATAKSKVDRNEIAKGAGRQWKWHPLLPVQAQDNIVQLGEGGTPLLKAPHLGKAIGLNQLFVKDESMNPTGTFKARGLTAAVSKAKEFGLKKLIIPTAGNAGGAMAAYASRAEMTALVIMPEDTPRSNVEEAKAYGAEVLMVKGLISDAGKLAAQKTEEENWFNVATFKEPYRVEGKKIMGYELAEDFAWELPEVIIYPTGGGTGLIGMWLAFHEMLKLGWLETKDLPRMVSVQSSGCAPIVKAFHDGSDDSVPWQNASTIASGLRVPHSFADHQILSILRESNGTAVEVSDEEITLAQKELGQGEGIFAAPEGAATYAGLKKLAGYSWVQPNERIVLFNTGSGMKYI
jgi:threonine synthase